MSLNIKAPYIYFMFFMLLILLNFNLLHAQNYYIDGINGNDANNGRSAQTAWRTLNKISNNTIFKPGDVIAIRDSIRYEGGLYFTSSGSSGNPITITNYYGSSSNRKPVIKASNTVSNWNNVSGNVWSASYTPSTGTVNQVWFEANKDNPAQTVWGIKETSQANLSADYEWYWESNVLYVYSTSDPDTRFDYVEADCQTAWNKTYVIFEQGNYVTVENLDVKYGKLGGIRIGNGGSNYVTIQDCKTSFTGLRTDESAHGIMSYNGYENIIRRNECFENSNHGIYIFANNSSNTTYNITVDSNLVYDNKHSQIDINTNGGHLDSVVCRYNTIKNNVTTWSYTDYGATPDGFFIGGQFTTNGGTTRKVYIMNNIAINIKGGAIDLDGSASDLDYIYIYNNTFYDDANANPPSGHRIVSIYNSSARVWFRNNIIYSSATKGLLRLSTTKNKILDHNLYYWANTVTLPFYGISSINNLEGWIAYTGQEFGTNNSNPNFINVPTDFSIRTGNAIDHGLPIDIVLYDINGVSRPQGSAWDIGAYEYKSGTVSTDNTPPTLVSASVINPTSIVLTFSEPLELTSAQAKSNYSINNGININSAVLSSDGKKVTLNTTTNSPDQTYTVVVSGVKDIAGNMITTSGNTATYSYTQTSIGNLKANVKVFLEGPLDSNVMLTELSGNEFLPSAQPYNTAPWFYGGKEVLGSGASSATDWVLVELHSAQDPSQIVAKRACLLRNDGRIMEPNGTLGVTFNNLFYGSYYIAVRHRNHLAVMSSSPVLFSPNNDLYDFTNSVNKAYGQNAMMQIASGVYAMYAGDGNGDGIIDDKDRDDLWNSQNGNMGYLNGDFNLDSGVTVKDINDFWNLNHDKKTQVP